AWWDLDLVAEQSTGFPAVAFSHRPFVRLGDVSRWLVSDAFDLGSARSLEAEETLQQAAQILSEEVIDVEKAKALDLRLRSLLGDTDPFWIRWRYVGEKQGWLP
ncbi:MAG: ATP-binding protein, partial [Pigmentiphaga sp.]